MFNRGAECDWALPTPPDGMGWDWRVDTADPDRAGVLVEGRARIPADSVSVFVLWGGA